MRTSLAATRRLAGRGWHLLLALVLCACGGAEGEAVQSDAAPEARALAATAAADSCTGPPPAYAPPVLTGPWQGLLDSLAADGVAFPDVAGNADTTSVKLCRTCSSVRVEIRSSNMTPCLAPGDLTGQPRITGMFVVLDTFPAQQGWETIPAGDSIFAFTGTTGGPATLVYEHGGSGKASPSNSWMFWYCQDGHVNGTAPRAEWKPRDGAQAGTATATAADGGTYGWMACISGCCEFYTPGAELIETPDVADPNAPDTVGPGRNQGSGSQRPSWCRTS